MKRLIVNADDLNQTDGVSRAILEAHEQGIVTSASFIVNLPISSALVREIKSRPALGVGIHLNVTLGEPLSQAKKVLSLLAEHGRFKRVPEYLKSAPKPEELFLEWDAQIQHFIRTLGKYPTHLDTHHQTHDRPLFFKVFCELSRKYYLPVRRSLLMKHARSKPWYRTTDHFFGDLDPKNYWKGSKLLACLESMPDGLSEIMCHPGYSDAKLLSMSSFGKAREEELKLFTAPQIKNKIEELDIQLTHFGSCYT